ncbi:MAG: hypothetical protein NC308_03195 [Clostridium sp.]|nr:hypothetical protein [Bacteroides sp.]MCM1197871.1 hypothetical protein [Clostridium sp.]
MGFFDIFYKWILPKQGAFLAKYQGNEQLYNMARSFWTDLENEAIPFLLIMLGIGILSALFYYYVYCNKPGRRYRIRHWILWMSLVAILTFFGTWGIGALLVDGLFSEKTKFLVGISFENLIYSIGLYFITSVVICNIPVNTNAYRFLKFGK